MTSELRALVCVPIADSASITMTSRPASASSRAIARPTTPAPITAQSMLSAIVPYRRKPVERQTEGAILSLAAFFPRPQPVADDEPALGPRLFRMLAGAGAAARSGTSAADGGM